MQLMYDRLNSNRCTAAATQRQSIPMQRMPTSPSSRQRGVYDTTSPRCCAPPQYFPARSAVFSSYNACVRCRCRDLAHRGRLDRTAQKGGISPRTEYRERRVAPAFPSLSAAPACVAHVRANTSEKCAGGKQSEGRIVKAVARYYIEQRGAQKREEHGVNKWRPVNKARILCLFRHSIEIRRFAALPTTLSSLTEGL